MLSLLAAAADTACICLLITCLVVPSPRQGTVETAGASEHCSPIACETTMAFDTLMTGGRDQIHVANACLTGNLHQAVAIKLRMSV